MSPGGGGRSFFVNPSKTYRTDVGHARRDYRRVVQDGREGNRRRSWRACRVSRRRRRARVGCCDSGGGRRRIAREPVDED